MCPVFERTPNRRKGYESTKTIKRDLTPRVGYEVGTKSNETTASHARRATPVPQVAYETFYPKENSGPSYLLAWVEVVATTQPEYRRMSAS